MASIGNITFAAKDPRALANFWAAVLEYDIEEPLAEISSPSRSRVAIRTLPQRHPIGNTKDHGSFQEDACLPSRSHSNYFEIII